MSHVPLSAGRTRQSGWGLLEAVVALSLMALMSIGVWKSLELAGRQTRSEQARDTLQRAEDALYGLALREHRLPMPEEAVVSTGRPQHWEGWLPAQVLGTEPPRSIRYVVHQSLATPATPLYRADPLGMLGDGVATRSSANGLDLCMKLVQLEQAGFAQGERERLAMAVQQPDAPDRAAGHVELVHRLGCIEGFARLAAEVKAATLDADISRMARLDVEYRDLAVRDTEASILNYEWRRVNAAARLAVSAWNLVASKLTAATTPMGTVRAGINIVGFSFEAARWSLQIEYSTEKSREARTSLEGARQILAQARLQAAARDARRDSRLQRVNALQARGLLP